MLIYKATNLVNGKAYVGLTRHSLKRRKNEHRQEAQRSSAPFHRAIAKYGFEAFTWEILRECETLAELAAAECELIALHGTTSKGKRGYNRTDGGGGTAGIEFSDELRARVSLAVRRRNFWKFQGRRQLGMFHHNVGRKHDKEITKRRGEASRGKPKFTKLPVEAIADIATRRQRGETFQAIGAIYGVTAGGVFHFHQRHSCGAP